MSQEPLVPVPYAQRRKGVTALNRGFPWVYTVLDTIGDGMPTDDFQLFLQNEHRGLKATSIAVQRSILRNDLQVITSEGDLVVPTAFGKRMKETRGAFVLAPRLLTTFVGIDHALVALRGGERLRRKNLLEIIRRSHPSWQTNMAASQQVSMMQGMGVITASDGWYSLTPEGERWAALVTWTPEIPEAIAPPSPVAEEESDDVQSETASFVTPSFNDVWKRIEGNDALHFDKMLVAAVHAGVWAHPRRHFAIFACLSGSGKTSLANAYGHALAELTGDNVRERICVVPVSPGWTDATPLLGYVKPLSALPDYEDPPFLKLLLRCEEHPSQIHVAILDEMNLSHPEQYLAPLLSAMELDRPLVIHNQAEEYDGVPPRLERYPQNLVLIGTVNMDETTHGLSDKVLDRATTLEFWYIDLAKHPRLQNAKIPPSELQVVKDALNQLLTLLEPHRLHFGFRAVDDIVAFLERAHADGTLTAREALDWVLHGKVLPKLRGHDTPALRAALNDVRELCVRLQLTRCSAKLHELLHDLQITGSARFWR